MYLNPPQRAAVFCVDEKTAIQALDRRDRVPSFSPGIAERHGFECKRNGTLSPYATLNTATGQVWGKMKTAASLASATLPSVIRCLTVCLALVLVLPLCAYEPTAENLEAREWFQDAKFGLFVHWGTYGVLGDGEWVVQTQRMTINEYERVPEQFNPIRFDAAEWVSMVKEAGIKYITSPANTTTASPCGTQNWFAQPGRTPISCSTSAPSPMARSNPIVSVRSRPS